MGREQRNERDSAYRSDVGVAGSCRSGGLCLFTFPDAAGRYSLPSFWGDYWPAPWDSLWKIRSDHQTGDYPNRGPSLAWVGSLNRYILMFKGFWSIGTGREAARLFAKVVR